MSTPSSVPHSERNPQPQSSVELARRLLAYDTPAGTDDPEVVAVGLRKTCSRVSSSLRNALGTDASNALLVRALTRVETQHPLIADLRQSSEASMSFDVLVKSVDEHGVAPVKAAIEALLAALIDILVRLVGEDMTVRLTAADAAPHSATNGGVSKS